MVLWATVAAIESLAAPKALDTSAFMRTSGVLRSSSTANWNAS
jgi:hypothetical protein